MRPIDAYKKIIDQLVTETSRSVIGGRVLEGRIIPHAEDRQDPTPFVQSLSAEQRQILAEMLHEERRGAIHDVLAVLTWWVVTRKVGFTLEGEPMPVELSGMGLHGDYVGRLSDWNWPEEGNQAPQT